MVGGHHEAALTREQLESIPLGELTRLCFEDRSWDISDGPNPIGYIAAGLLPQSANVVDLRSHIMARNRLETESQLKRPLGRLGLRRQLRDVRKKTEIPLSAVPIFKVTRQIGMDWANTRPEHRSFYGREFLVIRNTALAYERGSGALEALTDSEAFEYKYSYLVSSPTDDPRGPARYKEEKDLRLGATGTHSGKLSESEARQLILDYVLPVDSMITGESNDSE